MIKILSAVWSELCTDDLCCMPHKPIVSGDGLLIVTKPKEVQDGEHVLLLRPLSSRICLQFLQ